MSALAQQMFAIWALATLRVWQGICSFFGCEVTYTCM